MKINKTTIASRVMILVLGVAAMFSNSTAPAEALPSYTLGGDVRIVISWGPANCIELNWPTTTRPVCSPSGMYVAHQYDVRPGQIIGVDPVISGNLFASCAIVDESTGVVVKYDSGRLGDGYDINCLVNTY